MLAVNLLLLSVTQTPSAAPKTFEEFEIAKLNGYHNASSFSEEMTIVINGSVTLTRKTAKLQDKEHFSITFPDKSQIETVNDGKKTTAIFHAQKKYSEVTNPTEKFNAKEKLLKTEPNSFKFTFSSSSPVQFACDPPMQVSSVEDFKEPGGNDCVRMVAIGKGREGRTIKITQDFWKSSMVLRAFEVDGQGEEGPISVKGRATSQNFKQAFEPSEFQVPSAITVGYTKISQ